MKIAQIAKTLLPLVFASSLDVPAHAAEPSEAPNREVTYDQQLGNQTSFSYTRTSDGFSTIQIRRKDSNIETLIEAKNVDNNETIDYFSVQTIFYDAGAINYAFYHGPAYIDYKVATTQGEHDLRRFSPHYFGDFLFESYHEKIKYTLDGATYSHLSASEREAALTRIQKEVIDSILRELYPHLSPSEREKAQARIEKRIKQWEFIKYGGKLIIPDNLTYQERRAYENHFYEEVNRVKQEFYSMPADDEMGSLSQDCLETLAVTPPIRRLFVILDEFHGVLSESQNIKKVNLRKAYAPEIEELFKIVEMYYSPLEYLAGVTGEPRLVRTFIFSMTDAAFLRRENNSGDGKIYGVIQYRDDTDLSSLFKTKYKVDESLAFLPTSDILSTGRFSSYLYTTPEEAQKDEKFQMSPKENFDLKPAIYEIDLRTLDFTRVLDVNGKTIADLRGPYQFHPVQ